MTGVEHRLALDRISFERYLFRLRFTEKATFGHFLHGGVIHGLVGRALKSREMSSGILPVAPESGRMTYEAGEPYQFGLTLVPGSRDLLGKIQQGLLEISGKRDLGRGLPVAGNFALEAVETLPPVDLAAEITALRCSGVSELRFLSPLRLERPPGAATQGSSYFDRRCFPLATFLDRLWRRLFLLQHGRWPTEAERQEDMPSLPENARSDPSGLLWIDLPHPERGRTLGGALGRVALSGVPERWLPCLALGRHLHAGAATHFAFGRYAIGSLAAFELPARSFYECLGQRSRLERALDHVVEKSTAAGIDRVSPERFAEERGRRIAELALAIGSKAVEVSPFLGLPLRRDEGRNLRPVTIPTVADRVLQRAAAELLAPAVDTLFEDCSFAYRKGYSRAGAARAIQEAYRDGFRIVLDADISAFFDEVEWDRLFAMLDALFPGELLVSLLRRWIAAPVIFDGARLRRRQGLPQGAPISPLLAHLYLDELDDQILGEEFRLVRYADDFVVLCRDLEAAGRARERVEAALADLGLELNPETTIRSLDDGLPYLGYLFCRSLVLELADGELAPPASGGDPAVPARSWLAQVPLDRIKAVLDERGAARNRPPRIEAVPIAGLREPQRPLYVVSPDTRIFLRESRLVLEPPAGESNSVPAELLSHVVVLGKSRMTVPVLLSLESLGVPVYFCHPDGELRVRCESHPPDWPLWLAQARRLEDSAARLGLAREIVAAKLANQATLLVRHRFPGAEMAADRIRALATEVAGAASADAVRGFEGAGARIYFERVREEFGPAWAFEGRRHHRPPPDPVNALLSFVSTLLHHHVSTALVAAGLNPRLGLFHEPRGTYHALASDLQEELRFLADGTVWALLRRREIKKADFVERPGASYPVLLLPEPRKRVIEAFERRLLTEVSLDGNSARPWHELIDRQAQRLRSFIADPEAAPYRAIRAHG